MQILPYEWPNERLKRIMNSFLLFFSGNCWCWLRKNYSTLQWLHVWKYAFNQYSIIRILITPIISKKNWSIFVHNSRYRSLAAIRSNRSLTVFFSFTHSCLAYADSLPYKYVSHMYIRTCVYMCVWVCAW